MTPKIIFKYSWIYDQNWKEWIKVIDEALKSLMHVLHIDIITNIV